MTTSGREGSSQTADPELDTLRGKAPRFRRLGRKQVGERGPSRAGKCQAATPPIPALWDDPRNQLTSMAHLLGAPDPTASRAYLQLSGHSSCRLTWDSPRGSSPPSSLSAYQSAHHSQTFPCMSCRPQRLA